jgi:outer membrane protein TolC
VKYLSIFLVFVLTGLYGGCRTPQEHRAEIDEQAQRIIDEGQIDAIGEKTDFSITRPSQRVRQRLLTGQRLPMGSVASLGAEWLKNIEHWPKDNYLARRDPNIVAQQGGLKVSLKDALEIGAYNSFDYQDQKEAVFQSALSLELERDDFRNTFFGAISNLVSSDQKSLPAQSGTVTTGQTGVSRKFENGAELDTAIAVDLAQLFTSNGASSLGLTADASISIPLLRGAGKHIVTEPLIQAQRDVIYAIWDFERFKKNFAVSIINDYLSVLRQKDALKNSEEDYKSRIASARRSRRLADAGRLQEIEVDQALQNELSARQRWITAVQQYKKQLDVFKTSLGLPPDAIVELVAAELETLTASGIEMAKDMLAAEESEHPSQTPPADAPIEIVEPSNEIIGPLELEESRAIALAMENRLDLMVSEGQIYDAQRAIVVSADDLRAELTFFGSAGFGAARSISSAGSKDAQLRANRGAFDSLFTLDLPFERTAEAVNYRNSYILLEQAVRDYQELEDNVKLAVRNELRDMLQARENLYIQAKAVYLAEKRVKSVNLFLEAGRAQIRDLLEAQDSLLIAQNNLTAAVVDYRVAELRIQRDMGVLKLTDEGLLREYRPEMVNAEK